MKLTRLRLQGFKSFADRTEIDFHGGITAVVGPNGCGKSNISDAIRWVLGEQRPTAIRGAKMEEAIFQGSVNRRPVNRGSVAMTVSNQDGLLPVPFEEVEIGRTVYRDGGSEYAINRSACRLRDVHELCRDTGLGANAYNVIENRMIDAILSDRAEERRSMFEEAAGIGKYKDRRKAALRRLERADLDLERLEDVIAEVESKVRSLARQKGKAERYHEYRGRRLAVEVAVVRHQLDTLQSRLSEVEKILEGGARSGQGLVAELRTAETEYESLRIQQVEAEKSRAEAAGRLDQIRGELARWERDLAVARERAGAADRRREQIEGERAESGRAIAQGEETLTGLRSEAENLQGEREALRVRLEAQARVTEERRGELVAAREALDALEGRERDLARRSAVLEGDAEASEAQAAELQRRLERTLEELESTSGQLVELESQGDLFADRRDELLRSRDRAREDLEGAQAALAEARRVLDLRRVEREEAQSAFSEVRARFQALRRLEEGREGMEPVVQAALGNEDLGVLGTLADFIRATGPLAASVEAYLGPLSRGLLVRDREALGRISRWFREDWSGGGGLVVLPLDRVPDPPGDLPQGVTAAREGAPWVRALLGGARIVPEGALLDGPEGAGGLRIAPSTGSVDGRGIVRFGEGHGSAGILARQEELRTLETQQADLEARFQGSVEALDLARADLERAESELEEHRGRLREAEDLLRTLQAEEAAQSDRRSRAGNLRDELARQAESARAARTRALERAREAREDRQGMIREEEQVRMERREARDRLAAVQEAWEAARGEESRLTVDFTRVDGQAQRMEERLSDLHQSLKRHRDRLEALEAEEEGLRAVLREVAEVRERGAEVTEGLFRDRDEAAARLARQEEHLREVAEGVAGAERRVREARNAEREASDRRHRLELERQELVGRVGRIEERLEGEWGRPLEVLLNEAEPVEGEPQELEAELRELVVKLERLGPVNMLAVEEHAEESHRLTFLQEQREDLVSARDDLRKAIREINQTATGLFQETFQAIRTHFKEVHYKLFQGGEADLWLDDPEDPLESPIEIHACPRGKKTQRIDLLSGGERALTALSLLFAIYLVKPSPFCVLDEVDGPLDENNIGRFIRLLNEFKDRTQFVVITHNPRTIEAADWIYGVTMEEPGVSTIVGVKLEQALEAAGIST